MIYLSAQPAEQYFLWQLEIQLLNFFDLGIDRNNIHVVLSYDEADGIPTNFNHLEQFACLFYYTDTREGSKYTSSIRPHILQKHFKANSELVKEVIFYHDSDIVFRERIDENKFIQDEVWYLSDTRNYLSANYLKKYGEDFFKELCEIVNISPDIVVANIQNTGGAQYIMKRADSFFWKNVYEDSETIFEFLNNHNASRKDGQKVQAWCADMWAVLWNAWKVGKTTKLDDELDFCWPKDHISKWYNTKILHNAGVFQKDKRDYFSKLLYKKSNPYGIDFNELKSNTCSNIFTNLIKNADHKLKNRLIQKLEELTIVLVLSEINHNSYEQLNVYLNYLKKYIDTTILIINTNSIKTHYPSKLENVKFYNLSPKENVGVVIHKKVKTKYLISLSHKIWISSENIVETYNRINKDKNIFIIPYQSIKSITNSEYESFKETLNFKLINNIATDINQAKLTEEAFATSKRNYLKMGGENLNWSYFKVSGKNDERLSRARLLGLTIKTINSQAIAHENSFLSNKVNEESKKKYLERLLKFDNIVMRKEISLLNYSFSVPFRKKYTIHNDQFILNVINLKERKERRQSVINQFKYIDYCYTQVIDAIEHTSGNIGLWLSIVKAIKLHNFKKQDFCIICEDDLLLTSEFSFRKLTKIINDAGNLGLELICGGSTGGFSNVKKISDNLMWVDNYYSNQLLILSEDMCDKILKYDYKGLKAVDTTLSKLTNFKAIVYPYIAIQGNFGYSDVTHHNHLYPDDVSKRFKKAEDILKYEALKDKFGK